MNPRHRSGKGILLIGVVPVLLSILLFNTLAACATGAPSTAKSSSTPAATPSPTFTPTPTPSPTPTPVPLPPVVQDTGRILGVEGNPKVNYKGIPWVRLGYPTCGWGNLRGDVLKKTVENYHVQGVRVLLTVCQRKDDNSLYDTKPLNDAAQGNADAVQCGNEEMKYDPSVAFLYIPPDHFARFFDLCERAVHAVRSDVPVLLGSLDPHVGGIDYWPLVNQANYLSQMQNAMNSSVHPGGHWDWHTQTLGLIDSWHNGYPNGYTNSLYGLFQFWAQQFGVDLNSGQLGKHLWVVEGTGCFKGCGVNPYNSWEVAVSHILALITDVRTSMSYKVPFFYFSGQDFMDQGIYWPIGIKTPGGGEKPLRQDLGMGARSLNLTCGSRSVTVTSQEDLLAKLYSGCALPDNYVGILEY